MNLITIYTLDDYLLTRIALKKFFTSQKSFTLIGEFSNASSCLEALDKKEPDILFMDIELSGSDGLEVLKTIKEEHPKVKVVVLTSYENEERIILALANGACGYVIKNKRNLDLEIIIETVMKGNFWIDASSAKSAFVKFLNFKNQAANVLKGYPDFKNLLTQRELEVLGLMVEGKTNSQIAKEIFVSTNTIKAHVGKILAKLAAKDRVQAVVKALRANLF